MNVLDLDRLKTIANFLENQVMLEGVPPHGLVQINNEEATIIVDALREYVLREYALGNERANEWDTLRGFYRRWGIPPKKEPACLVCEKRLPATIIRVKDLPHIVVCNVCRAKALTEDIAVQTDDTGRGVSVTRMDEHERPLSVLWRYQPRPRVTT